MTKILPLSNLVKWVDARNKTLVSTNLLGINIEKYFMPSVANIIGTDLSSYKVINKFQFACNPMHVGRDEKMPIALYDKEEPSIVSPAYFVFEVLDSQIINPEYLMLWFKRPEFDREVWFHTDGSVRGGITWEEILEMTVPVPSIEEQKAIVDKYKSIENRISVLRQINDNLESQIYSLFQTLFAKNENYSLWETHSLSNLVGVIDNRGKTPPCIDEETDYPLLEIASIRTNGRIIDYNSVEKYVNAEIYNEWFRSGHPKKFDIIMSTVGSLAELKLFVGNKGCIAQNLVAFRCHNSEHSLYLYQYLNWKRNELLSYEIGSVQASIKVSQVINMGVTLPPISIIEKFNSFAEKATNMIYSNCESISSLERLKKVSVSMLSSH